MDWLKNLFSGSTSQTTDYDNINKNTVLMDDEAIARNNRSEDMVNTLAYYVISCKSNNRFDRTLSILLHTFDTMLKTVEYDGKTKSLENVKMYFNDIIAKEMLRIYQKPFNKIENNIYYSIYEFAEFLIIANKLLLYNNDDTENVYSISESNDSIKLMIINDDYNIGYYFTKQLTTDKNRNILEEYVNDTNTDSMIGFIEIKRNTGAKLKSNYGFDMDGNFKCDSFHDKILFNMAINITKNIILDIYRDILNISFPRYLGLNIDRFDLIEYLDEFESKEL